MNLQLISDKAALFFLAQFSNVPKEVEETKHLIERKIAGDNPTDDEWKGNIINITAYNHAYTKTNKCAHYYSYRYRYAYRYPHATSRANGYNHSDARIHDYVHVYANAFAYPYLFTKAKAKNDDYANANANANAIVIATVDYIIHLLNGDIEPTDKLEQYFGPWMAAAIIHKISTGEYDEII